VSGTPHAPRIPVPMRGAVRTQVMALLAWALGSGALAVVLFPPLAAALFTLLLGLVIVATLRTRLTFGLAAAALGAVVFTISYLVLVAMAGGSAVARQGIGGLLGGEGTAAGPLWAEVVVAVVVLMVSAGLADGISGVIAEAIRASDGQRSGAHPPEDRAAAASAAPPPGWARAAWELARAVHYRRPLTVALLSVDDATEQQMATLDQLLEANLSEFEAVCSPGALERLLVLPEEAVRDLRDAAQQLCASVATRLGRAVRMALAGYPEDGSDLDRILDRLRADLVASHHDDTSPLRVDNTASTSEPPASGDDVGQRPGPSNVSSDEADGDKADLTSAAAEPEGGPDSGASDYAPTPVPRRRRRPRNASR
jgi:hypothetical protein